MRSNKMTEISSEDEIHWNISQNTNMYFSERTGIQRCFVSLLLVLGLTNVAGREIK